jgi:hypothetical protein
MKIYNYGYHDEIIEVPEEHLFLGSCKGVVLLPRGKNDNHVCFVVVTEDDGLWFCSKNKGSSGWIGELAFQLERAEKWLKKNAIGEVYGYRFRS